MALPTSKDTPIKKTHTTPDLLSDDYIIRAASENMSESVKKIVKGVRGPFVQNVVQTCRDFLPFGFHWDTKRLAYIIKGHYNGKQKGNPCVKKLRDVVFMIFRNGVINAVGGKSIPQNVYCLHMMLRRLRRLCGFRMVVHDLSVKNILSTCYMDHTVDIPSMKEELGLAVYDPEKISFIKICLAVTGGYVTCLIFDSGNMVFMQATNYEQLNEARDVLAPYVARFTLRPLTEEEKLKTAKTAVNIIHRLVIQTK